MARGIGLLVRRFILEGVLMLTIESLMTAHRTTLKNAVVVWWGMTAEIGATFDTRVMDYP